MSCLSSSCSRYVHFQKRTKQTNSLETKKNRGFTHVHSCGFLFLQYITQKQTYCCMICMYTQPFVCSMTLPNVDPYSIYFGVCHQPPPTRKNNRKTETDGPGKFLFPFVLVLILHHKKKNARHFPHLVCR